MSYIKDKPTFDENGVCCIDEIDIEYIAYGVGILGMISVFFNVTITRMHIE